MTLYHSSPSISMISWISGLVAPLAIATIVEVKPAGIASPALRFSRIEILLPPSPSFLAVKVTTPATFEHKEMFEAITIGVILMSTFVYGMSLIVYFNFFKKEEVKSEVA